MNAVHRLQEVVAAAAPSSQRPWVLGISVTTLLGVAVVPLHALAPLFVVALAAGAWWGGAGLAWASATLATFSLALSEALRASPHPGEALCLVAVFGLAALVVPRARAHLEHAHEQARVDPLTGVLTRQRFFELAELELERSRRIGLPLTVAFVDVDGLKALNDGHGHAAGDVALRSVGRVLRASLRTIDLIGRVGGDEFVLLLPGTLPGAARQVLSRVRTQLAQEARRTGLPVSVSVGITGHASPPGTAEALVAAADRAMYAEKQARTRPVPVHVFTRAAERG